MDQSQSKSPCHAHNLITPNMALLGKSVIVIDPKGELAAIEARRQASIPVPGQPGAPRARETARHLAQFRRRRTRAVTLLDPFAVLDGG
jgi:type IV secretory pathway TraG/TraD family ATPase VirD4